MKHNIKKQFWLSERENRELERKASECCLSQADFIRLLILGYQPRARPPQKFYDAMKKLSSISNNINQLAVRRNAINSIDSELLNAQVKQWSEFQLKIERTYLKPIKEDIFGGSQ